MFTRLKFLISLVLDFARIKTKFWKAVRHGDSWRLVMPEISFYDTLKALEGTGAVQPSQRDKFLENYEFFEKLRPVILQKYPHSWVAAVEEKLYAGSTLRGLETELDALPRQAGSYAYIEQIP
jgi:hypothetical protein